ncbi:hypothetical protein MRX96_034556 [Rhipicephalus microplus]
MLQYPIGVPLTFSAPHKLGRISRLKKAIYSTIETHLFVKYIVSATYEGFVILLKTYIRHKGRFINTSQRAQEQFSPGKPYGSSSYSLRALSKRTQ